MSIPIQDQFSSPAADVDLSRDLSLMMDEDISNPPSTGNGGQTTTTNESSTEWTQVTEPVPPSGTVTVPSFDPAQILSQSQPTSYGPTGSRRSPRDNSSAPINTIPIQYDQPSSSSSSIVPTSNAVLPQTD